MREAERKRKNEGERKRKNERHTAVHTSTVNPLQCGCFAKLGVIVAV